jgi:phage shock protein PspC (stress-responsive transcriptional regulator)
VDLYRSLTSRLIDGTLDAVSKTFGLMQVLTFIVFVEALCLLLRILSTVHMGC